MSDVDDAIQVPPPGRWIMAVPLKPTEGRKWSDMPGPPAMQEIYALLDQGIIEAWQDEAGGIRLYLARPPCNGDSRPLPRPPRPQSGGSVHL